MLYIIFAIFSFIVKLAQNVHNFSMCRFLQQSTRGAVLVIARVPVTKFSNSQASAMRLDKKAKRNKCLSQKKV